MIPRFEAHGWQAVVADQFTFENLKMVVQAICNYVRRQQSYIDNFPPRLVVGYDSRFMGRHFARVAAEVITHNGLDVYLSDRAAPTPVISWMIQDRVCTGAVMITGANESAEYNGVKFITSHMAIASEDITESIEQEIQRLSTAPGHRPYSPTPGDTMIHNPKPAYFQQIRNCFNLRQIASEPMDITVDYLYGIASGYMHEIFREAGGVLREIENSPHSDFGSLVPVLSADNLYELRQVVVDSRSALAVGIAMDGDGTNLQAIGHCGTLIAHDRLFGLLIDYLVTEKEWRGGVIKPNCQHDFAEQVATFHGLPLIFAHSVDFRLITAAMVHEEALIASDGLGGYAFQGHIMERDAIFAALLLLEVMTTRKQNLEPLLAQLAARIAPQGSHH
jgi:phosphoglucomutase